MFPRPSSLHEVPPEYPRGSAEQGPDPDALVRRYLGNAALSRGIEPLRLPESRTFAGLNFSELEVRDAIALVRLAETMPGIAEANAALVKLGDQETLDHQYRVAVLAVATARRAKLSADEVQAMAIAGLIHDTGKAQVYDVMSKTGKWTEDERRRAESHPANSVVNAQKAGITNQKALDLSATHHMALKENAERFARPYGVEMGLPESERASQLARLIFAGCDYIDARSNPRRYNEGVEPPTAPQVIEQMPDELAVDEVYELFEGMLETPVAA